MQGRVKHVLCDGDIPYLLNEHRRVNKVILADRGYFTER
jgi:hypothetical protein